MIDMDAARLRLANQTRQEIDAASAWSWASLALAALERFVVTSDLQDFADAVDFEHEAREHAAGGDISEAISQALEQGKMNVAAGGKVT